MKIFTRILALTVLALGINAAALADCVLRQSTASQELALPRFVDSTDGVTAETGLTIANTDIKLTKGGGTSQVNKNSGGATHIATGDYYAVLDATDTDTVGNLHIVIGVSGALPVWVDCIVLEEAVYDADYAAAATGQRSANVLQFNGGNVTASSGRPEVNVTHLAGTTLATLTGPYPQLGIVESGTAQGATSSTFQFRSAAAFANNEPNGWTCGVTGGSAGVGQAFTIASYVGSTDTATITMGASSTFATTPTGTITYVCFGSQAGGTTVADIWGYATRRLTEFDEDNMTIDINATPTGAAASVTGSVGSVTGNVGGNVAGSVGSVTGAVGGAVASVTGNVGGNVVGNVNGSVASVGTNGISANSLATDGAAEIAAATLTAQGLLTGTCASGSTTTCVDAARTEASAELLEDRMACFSDGWCGLITTFAPGSDTATFTKVAPSTRASKTYTIFPSTLE